ncbi:fimbrial biogenesis chaperone [Candidimonas nitroreducens]|uniref:fimbrial biogenesis chaperone n=1 Tax=Candidimonas nitroreducens TaxID=683354 RepID=UPI0013036F77|nr:fimbria/pilus periplasmic chaperone [Candidimonas nitroreducens]
MLVQLSSKQSADELWLSNTGSVPLQAQVRVYQWEQQDGRDVLAPTTELAASPPMVSIGPGQRQMVRVIRVGVGAAPASTERSFRILVDEIPPAGQSGIQFALRYSIPVFVAGSAAEPSKPVLTWGVRRSGAAMVLQASNAGNGYAQITEASFKPQGAPEIMLSKGLYGYVLAGKVRDWGIDKYKQAFLKGGVLSLKVNRQAIHVSLPPMSSSH